jgi:F0F1-type ATP synthase assembly protein I
MSLKAFHVLFITLSILLCAGCAIWAFANGVTPIFGWASAVLAVALVVYEIFFLRKAKRIIT